MAVEHQALLHRTDEELLTVVAPLLRHAVERGEPAVLVTTPRKLSLLRDGLGDDAASVRYVDAPTGTCSRRRRSPGATRWLGS